MQNELLRRRTLSILLKNFDDNRAIYECADEWTNKFKREIISLHETKGLVNFEETKQLFLNNVLSESLDDGVPLYYNSNILGRYMRKDYGQFQSNIKNKS